MGKKRGRGAEAKEWRQAKGAVYRAGLARPTDAPWQREAAVRRWLKEEKGAGTSALTGAGSSALGEEVVKDEPREVKKEVVLKKHDAQKETKVVLKKRAPIVLKKRKAQEVVIDDADIP